ncbi:hypothetical protein ABK040_010052 [Willaertia magna]
MVECDRNFFINIALQIINLCVGIALIVVAILRFVGVGQSLVTGGNFALNVALVILGIYMILFGLLIILFTLFFPRILLAYFGFYQKWIGRGLFFIFLAGIAVSDAIMSIVLAIVVAIVGIIYCVFQFIPIIPPPRALIPIFTDDEESKK